MTERSRKGQMPNPKQLISLAILFPRIFPCVDSDCIWQTSARTHTGRQHASLVWGKGKQNTISSYSIGRGTGTIQYYRSSIHFRLQSNMFRSIFYFCHSSSRFVSFFIKIHVDSRPNSSYQIEIHYNRNRQLDIHTHALAGSGRAGRTPYALLLSNNIDQCALRFTICRCCRDGGRIMPLATHWSSPNAYVCKATYSIFGGPNSESQRDTAASLNLNLTIECSRRHVIVI